MKCKNQDQTYFTYSSLSFAIRMEYISGGFTINRQPTRTTRFGLHVDSEDKIRACRMRLTSDTSKITDVITHVSITPTQ